MAEEKKNNSKPNPKGKPNKTKRNWVLYSIYGIIIVALGSMLLDTDGSGEKQEIRWDKMEKILMNHDYERIVVVNEDFAEVYLSRRALRSDTSYRDLIRTNFKGETLPVSGFYKYDFVTFENFEKDLARVEEKTGERIDLVPEKRSNAWREMLLMFGPFILIIVFFVIMNRVSQRQMGGGGGGGIFNMGKTNAKMYDGKVPTNVTFKDVAGLKGAKEEVVEVVDFLKNPKKYTDLGGKIPKGVLLVGPPGTGKTLLAKAVAGEAKVPFFSTSGSDFVEMFVGMGASRVRSLFEEAKKKSPCIIFIDEIDAVGRARGRSGLSNANDERENTLNALLTEMDGFGSGTNVIVLAATNRVDVLDKALLRAGRFDRQVQVDLPDLDEREAIFEVHTRKLKLGTDIDRSFLAKQTPGFSGADIANVCNEAALVAARKSHSTIEKQDFLDAVDRIIGGIEKPSKALSDAEKHTVAYHESGHASVSWLTRWGDPLVKVTIVPRGHALGAAWYLPEERQLSTYEQMLDNICSLMAGRAAEEIFVGSISTGALNDMERATKMAFSLVAYYGMSPEIGNLSYYDSTGQSDFNFTKPFSEKTSELIDREVRRIVEEQYQRAKQIISEHRDQMEQLAAQLYDKEVLFRDDLERIYGRRPWEPEKIEGTKAEETPQLQHNTDEDAPATAEDFSISEQPKQNESEEQALNTDQQ